MRYLFLLLSLCSVQFILGNFKIYPNNTGKTNEDISKGEQPDSDLQGKLTALAAANDKLPISAEENDISSKCKTLLSEEQYKEITNCFVLDENNKIYEIINPES